MTLLLASLALVPAPGFVLCIDAGHPSEVNDGRALQNGLREVTICWQIATELKSLAQAAGVRVVMTKQSERQMVTNRRRAEIANAAGADLMLRLHADAGAGSGFTTYFPNKQGKSHGVIGPSADVIRKSRSAASSFHPAFAVALRGELADNGAKGDEKTAIGSKQGALTGSVFSKVPALLVEMVFLSNKKDAQWIAKPANRTKMAKALLSGVLAVMRRRGAEGVRAVPVHWQPAMDLAKDRRTPI